MTCPISHAIATPLERGPDEVWTVNSHRLTTEVALDDVTFSSGVSRFLQVPNGLDGAEHDAFRALIDRYMTGERVAELEYPMTEIALEVVTGAIDRSSEIDHETGEVRPVDAVGLGAQFAVRASCAWLGWPMSLERELLNWVRENWDATRSGEYTRTAAAAAWYNSIITSLLNERRVLPDPEPGEPWADVTHELMGDMFLGRALTDAEVTSILRNWTGGDLGSMALCAGVVLAYLADHLELQDQLRAGVSDADWALVIDEILRIDDPFTANRRVATRDVELGGQQISAGDRLRLNWTAANRDPEVFTRFDPAGNAGANIVYGIGRHVCPGRELSTVQLRIITQAVLSRTRHISPARQERTRSLPPVGGYWQVPLILEV